MKSALQIIQIMTQYQELQGAPKRSDSAFPQSGSVVTKLVSK